MKLPIGIQGFEKIITDDFLYIDKTEYIYKLVHNNVPYFLSRPRRFGKSLLLSTLRAYWEGRKELFKGLKIEKLEENNPEAWRKYPVFFFDFNGVDYQEKGALERTLDFHLKAWEIEFALVNDDNTLAERFRNLMKRAKEESGLRCVVLVDEYDKPFLDVVNDTELQERNKEVFKAFFSSMKSLDEYIQFVFITGVSKFHKVSIFSDLNQLKDISLSREFSSLCGITEQELRRYFGDDIINNSQEMGISENEYYETLKKQYDGYHFYQGAEGIFNPFSVLNSFFDKEFSSYWFETGTPSFLVEKVKKEGFDLRKFSDRTIYANEAVLKDYTGDTLDLVPLLYQTGYLTIEDYDRRRNRYTLSFPNDEVKYGFLESLMPLYVPKATVGNGLDIFTLEDHIENGRLEDVRNVLAALFANLVYTTDSDPFEHYFQAVIYLVFTLLGKFTICEMHTYRGRIDCKVETRKYIYLFEFKRDESAETALKQINEQDYALAFAADGRKVFKIGVSFDSKSRMLSGWETED